MNKCFDESPTKKQRRLKLECLRQDDLSQMHALTTGLTKRREEVSPRKRTIQLQKPTAAGLRDSPTKAYTVCKNGRRLHSLARKPT